MTRNPGPQPAMLYEIVVLGQLDGQWSEWLSGMTISSQDDVTTLTGPVVDQAALRGLLSKIWDLNLTLISVTPITAGRGGEQEAGSGTRHS
jgi:hypothetical protein